jgi:hypothetical protein
VSYLDVPRFHFSGQFFADPATSNNFAASYNNASPMPSGPRLGWNPDGRHHYQLRNCVVRSTVGPTGTVSTTAAQDKLVTGTVVSTDSPSVARLVDLDPGHQFGSQIWGLAIRVQDTASEGFTGVMEVASLRELWGTRAPGGFSVGMGGTHQSVITGITWTPAGGTMQSPLLQALRAASPTRLSIRLVTWAFVTAAADPARRTGQMVGTIGPATATEPAHFIPDRRLIHAATSGPAFGVAPINSAAFNTAPFKVDAARRRLVIDLGNALPEDAAGARRSIGALRAEIVNPRGAAATVLGSAAIPNAMAGYRVNAGVEEITLTQAQTTALATRPLQLKAGPDLVMAERTAGIHVDVDDTVIRLNPTETKDVELVVTQLGRPMPNANVHVGPSLARTRPASLTALSIRTGPPAFATTLTTLPAVVRTGSNGRVKLRLVAGNPGNPRTHIDGALSFIGFFVGATATAATLRGEIVVRVFDAHTVPANPVFADVEPILTQYFRLYPSMRTPTAARPFGFVDLNDLAQVQPLAPVLAASLRRPETAPNYMPVTRDLSRDKKALLLRWFDAGAPA